MGIFLMEEQKRLDALKQRVDSCTDCEFHSTRTQPVFGEGPLGAAAMAISEAPGKDEDESGRPYMGKAGKYWEVMLQTAGLRRESIYVCNALCCRPPNNAIPEDYHNIHACNVRLLTQIAIIQPRLIITFGKVAAFALGLVKKSASLGSIVGKQQLNYNDYKGTEHQCPVIVTYHPSYLMRGGLKQQADSWKTYNHLREARSILDGLVIPENTE
jgi:uracil-DNA glycosylase